MPLTSFLCVQPDISRISPATGPIEGRTAVSIYGSGMLDTGSCSCRFGTLVVNGTALIVTRNVTVLTFNTTSNSIFASNTTVSTVDGIICPSPEVTTAATNGQSQLLQPMQSQLVQLTWEL